MDTKENDEVKNWKEYLKGTDNIVSFELAKLLSDKGFRKATNLFYTHEGKLSSDAYHTGYRRGKIPRSDWNARRDNRNAKPWYAFGYSAPDIEVVNHWILTKFGMVTESEEDVFKVLNG